MTVAVARAANRLGLGEFQVWLGFELELVSDVKPASAFHFDLPSQLRIITQAPGLWMVTNGS